MISKVINKYQSLDANFKQVLRKGAGAFGVRIAGALAAFSVNIYLARLLGASGFGLFSLSLTIISLLSVFNRFGLDTVVLRDISKDKNAAENGQAAAIFLSVSKMIIPAAFILMGAVIFLSPWVSEVIFTKPQLSPVLRAMAPLLLFLSLGYILSEGLKGLHHTEAGIFLQSTMLPIGFMVIVFGCSQLFSLTPESTALIYSGVAILGLLSAKYYWNTKIAVGVGGKYIDENSLIRKGFPLLLMSSGGLLLTWTDVIVLGVFESEETVGVYMASSKVALITSLLLVSANAIIAPKFSRLYASGNSVGLKKLANQATRLMTLLVLLPSILFLSFPELILSVFGPGFEKGATVLMILTVGQFINVACGSVGYMLVMTGNQHVMRNIMLGAAFMNIVLSVSLVSILGMIGVALSTALSVVSWNLVALYAVRRYSGFWMLG